LGDYWFLLALLSTLLNGLRAFVTKRAVEAGTLPAAGRLIPPVVMVLLSLPAVWLQDSVFESRLALVGALLQGSLFYIAAASRWSALNRGTPGYVLYPIVQSSTPLIVILSAFLFREWATIRQPQVMVGIIMATAATYVLTDWHKGGARFKEGLALAALAAVASAGATLAAKFAFSSTASGTVFSFIVVSNLAGVMVAGLHTFATTDPTGFGRRDWLWGLGIGALNFGGLALFLQAIRYGELSLVASVGALSLVVPIVLGALFDGEHLTLRQEATILLSLFSLLLLAQG
jgi:drug/metabolite transporter (DMT)-like permease